MSEDRCELSDLPVGTCACRRCRPAVPAVPRDNFTSVAWPSTKARFDSLCPGCGQWVFVDDPISLLDGEWVCVGCST